MRSLILFIYLIGAFAFAETDVPLQQLLKTSVEQSLSVQSQGLDAQSKGSLVQSSDAWMNPQILLETQRGDDNTASPINNFKATLLQPISTPWSLRIKKKLAQSTLAISEHHYEDEALLTQVNMMKSIFEYTARREILRSMEAREQRFQLLQKYISTRKHLSPQKAAESLIVSNKISVIQKEIAMAHAHLQHLWNKMNVLLQWEKRDTFPRYEVKAPLVLNREELFSKLEAQNHDIELAGLELTHAQQVRQMESWQRWPDIALAATKVKGREGNPEDNYSLGVNISLPLFNLNRYKTKAADFQVQASEKKSQLVRQEVRLSLDEAFDHYKVLKEFLDKYPTSQLGRLHREMETVVTGFKRGQVDLLTFFEADASTFERIQQVWSLQSEFVNAVADISFLTGEILSVEGQK